MHKKLSTNPVNAIAFTIAILGLVAILLIWYSKSRIKDFSENQKVLIQANINAAANEISLYIQSLREKTSLFVQDRIELIEELSINPKNFQAYMQLKGDTSKHLQHHFAFTITDYSGIALLEGLDKLVGKGCRRDIKSFSSNLDYHRIYIHSSPQNKPFHYDIMVPWLSSDGKKGIFFVSFFINDIARLISAYQSPGTELIIVREDKPDIIELTAEGARDELLRESKLSKEELKNVIFTTPISSTRWELLALTDPKLLDTYSEKIKNEALVIFILFSLVTLIILYFICRFESQTQARDD